jgi:hypothetical protein
MRPATWIATASLLLAIISVSPARAQAPGPTATFTWSLPDRTVDANNDGRIDHYYVDDVIDQANGGTIPNSCCSVPTDQIDPSTWPVQFNACDSTPSDGATIEAYTFTVDGYGAAVGSQGVDCHQTVNFPAQGPYTVNLTVTEEDQDGHRDSVTTSQAITVRDILVAGLGDSYGSGEGNYPYEDARCDRSTASAQALAALHLEQADPDHHTSVTFIHLSCSGAKILDPALDDGEADGGLVDPYDGVNPVQGAGQSYHEALPAQIDELKQLVGSRHINFLLLSIGGNDMGFASIIKDCIDPGYVIDFYAWLTAPNCNEDHQAGLRDFDAGIASLPDHFRQLSEALDKLGTDSAVVNPRDPAAFLPILSPESVYITEYPDPTTDDLGNYCGYPNPGTANSPVGFDADEFKWASQTVATSLNAELKKAADAVGWNYVGGIADRFFKHGYCASNRWLYEISDSLLIQGDTNGSFHPNVAGQSAIAQALTPQLDYALAHPPVPPSIRFYPFAGGLFGFAVYGAGGARGWYTGECTTITNVCDREGVPFEFLIQDSKGLMVPTISLSVSGVVVTASNCQPQPPIVTFCDFAPTDGGANPKGGIFSFTVGRSGNFDVQVSATDTVSRTLSKALDVKLDLDPPEADTPVITKGTEGTNGWYTSPVGLSFTAHDPVPGSGLNRVETLLLGEAPDGGPIVLDATGDPTTGPVDATLSDDGDHMVGYEAVDNAELRSGQLTFDVKLDQTAPTVTCGPQPTFIVGGPGGAIDAAVIDATSGPTQTNISTAVTSTDTMTPGAKTKALTGHDNAGNATSVTCPYTVAYGFLGFEAPLPKVKLLSSASTVPVKFRIGDYAGVRLDDVAASKVQTEVTISRNQDGSSPLSTQGCVYSTIDQLYRCNLKTPKGVNPYPTPYYVTAYELVGGSYVKVPAAPTATTPDPEIVYFK